MQDSYSTENEECVFEHYSCLGISSLKFCVLAEFVVKMTLSSDSGQYRHIYSNNCDEGITISCM
jgi:hypothetical protein